MTNPHPIAERLLPTCDSDDYHHTFYGILNKDGEFWTPLPFHDERAARDHLSRWAQGDYLSMLKTHKIVPVRVQLTARAQATDTPTWLGDK